MSSTEQTRLGRFFDKSACGPAGREVLRARAACNRLAIRPMGPAKRSRELLRAPAAGQAEFIDWRVRRLRKAFARPWEEQKLPELALSRRPSLELARQVEISRGGDGSRSRPSST